MDLLNEEYPLYPPNPNPYSDSDKEEVEKLRNRDLPFDLFCIKYSDELWNFWCICKEHNHFYMLPFFDKINYNSFCHFCFKNSKK